MLLFTVIGGIIVVGGYMQKIDTVLSFASDINSFDKRVSDLENDNLPIAVSSLGERTTSLENATKAHDSSIYNADSKIADLNKRLENSIELLRNEIESLSKIDPRIQQCSDMLKVANSNRATGFESAKAYADAVMRDYGLAGCADIIAREK